MVKLNPTGELKKVFREPSTGSVYLLFEALEEEGLIQGGEIEFPVIINSLNDAPDQN